MKKIRFLLHLVQAFFRRHFILIFAGSLLGIGAFFVSQKFLSIPQQKTQKIGLVGRFGQDEIPEEIKSLVSLGLTKILPDGTATSSLARSWEVNQENKVFKFYLADDIFWQDGTRLTARNVRLELKNAKIETPYDFQIKITLPEPFSPLPGLLSRPLFKDGFTGLSDYKVASVEKAGRFLKSILLTAVGNKNLPDLFYRFYNTEEIARVGLKLGEVDRLLEMTNADDFSSWPKIKITPELRINRYVAVFINTRKTELGQKNFRQALAYAVKKEEGEKRALGPLNPSSWAYNLQVKPYFQDKKHAQELLGEKSTKTEIELLTFPSLLSVAEAVGKDWEELGIKTKIRVINFLPDDYEALLATQEIPADPDQYFLWHSTQNTNLTGLSSLKIDKLLEEGRKTFDRQKRKEIYLDFQKTLVEECPAIFLFHPTLYTISREL
jgi:peptide/nickel transport system substrate-binding protein